MKLAFVANRIICTLPGLIYKNLNRNGNMLVLSRREGQSILLPELNIEISILKTTGSRVQIGIEAPREIAIQRGELTSASALKMLKLAGDSHVSSVPTEAFAKSDSDVLTVRSATEGYAVLSA